MTVYGVSLDTLLTAASILVAMAGWMVAAEEQRRQARKKHTFDILLSTDTSPELVSALDEVDNRAQTDPPLPREAIKSIDPSLRRAMNFYEFLSAAVRNKTLDEKLVRTTLRTRILRIYDYTRELALEIRDKKRFPSAMEHLEWFAVRRLGYVEWKRSQPAREAE